VRVAVVGGKTFWDRDAALTRLDALLRNLDPAELTIVHGARADGLIEAWAAEHGVRTERHVAREEDGGRGPRLLQDRVIFSGVNLCVMFICDGPSPVEWCVVRHAIKAGIPIDVLTSMRCVGP
jgi:hypothetical protein